MGMGMGVGYGHTYSTYGDGGSGIECLGDGDDEARAFYLVRASRARGETESETIFVLFPRYCLCPVCARELKLPCLTGAFYAGSNAFCVAACVLSMFCAWVLCACGLFRGCPLSVCYGREGGAAGVRDGRLDRMEMEMRTDGDESG